MVTIRYAEGKGWYDARVEARAPIPMDPATAVLHYAQEIFEGLKAYRTADGGVAHVPRRTPTRAGSRPRPQRMAMPHAARGAVPRARCAQLIKIDRDWIPHDRRRAASTCGRSCSPARSSSACARPRSTSTGDRLAGRPVLHRRRQAGHRLGLAGLHPRGARRHRRGQVRRQLRRRPGRPGRGHRARLRPGGLPRRGGAQLRRRARRHEHLLRVRRRHAGHAAADRHDPARHHPRLGHHAGPRRAGREVEERPVSFDEWRADAASGRLREAFACGTAAVHHPDRHGPARPRASSPSATAAPAR